MTDNCKFPISSPKSYSTISNSFEELITFNCNCNSKHVYQEPFTINTSTTFCVKITLCDSTN